MSSDKLAKILFYTVGLGGVSAALFLYGMWSGYYENRLFRITKTVAEYVRQGGQGIAETSLLRPDHLIQPARYEGSGVTVNKVDDRGELIMLSGFFGQDSEIRLLRRDGTIVKRWPLLFSEIFDDASFLPAAPRTDWNVDTHGALVMPDGSIVFNFDYSGSARIDACGRVVWTLKHQSHHSIERSERGGFWIPGQNVINDGETIYPPFAPPFVESTILRVSEDGRILQEISVPKLFYDNNLEALLTSSAVFFGPRQENAWNREIVHLNKVDELSSSLAGDFPQFEVGDILLSFRNLNMVMVVDPDSQEIKWWHIGPWLRQHDPEFRRGGTIAVFNNNIYMHTAFRTTLERTTKTTSLDVPRVSNIVEVDPKDGDERVLYGNRPGEYFLSVTRGKVEMTDGQGLLVTEFDGGRVFETDANGDIVWEYVNRYDEDEVAEITEARIYPADYFTVQDWTCDSQE